MVKLSAFADEVDPDFGEQVTFLQEHGIGFLEIRFVDGKNVLDLSKGRLVEVKNLLEDNGIGVSAIASPIGKIAIDEPFDPHLEKFKRAVELAEYLDAPLIRVFSYYPPDGQDIHRWRGEVLDRMARKAELLEGKNIILVHENETGIFGHSAENCRDIVESVGSPKLRLAYDPANFVWGQNIRDNVRSCWPLLKPYVSHVHIKDWKLGSRSVGSLPGEGDGQIPDLLRELAATGYEGFLTLEPHLREGGQFGGDSGPELFERAITMVRMLCSDAGIECG